MEFAAAHPGKTGFVARLAAFAHREYGLFLAATGAIALYLVDDAFLHPEPGMSAGDHLVSGLVSLTLLTLAALAYPRLRAGARASMALALGLTALGAGIAVPVRHTMIDEPRGDDFTGILATLAGLLLVVLGAVTLWRSRRGGSRKRRYTRRALIGVVAAIVGFELIAPIAFGFGFTHKARSPVAAVDLGRPYEEVSFITSDGLRLAGWYVPSENGASVIAFPGRSGPVEHARMLIRHGYGVLLFDRRGEGESDGDGNLFGWDGGKDLKAAISFLQSRPDVDEGRIGGLGLSVGGELMLETAATTDRLKAVVSEGAGFRSIREASELSGASSWLLLPQTVGLTATTALFANQEPPPNLKDLIPRIAPRPVFFIFATHGQGGEALNPAYYDAPANPRPSGNCPRPATRAPSMRVHRSTSGALSPSSTAPFFESSERSRHGTPQWKAHDLAGDLVRHAASLDRDCPYPPHEPDEADRWVFVHFAQLALTPFLAFAVWMLLDGVHSKAATVSRIAVVTWVVFFSAYDSVAGIATGLLSRYADGLAGQEEAAVRSAIDYLFNDGLLPGGAANLGIVTTLAWPTAVIAGALALRKSGARPALVVALGLSALAFHASYPAAIGLVAFLVAAGLRVREETSHEAIASRPIQAA